MQLPADMHANQATGAIPRIVWLVLGPALLIGWIWLVPSDLPAEAHRLVGILLLTIVWWLGEPIPIPITGLLAVCLAVILGCVPAGAGQSPDAIVLAPFADPSLYFLLGGMFIAQAMMRHGLDRRFALLVLTSRWAGRNTFTVLAALGLVVTLISMWISNTAATAMMYPIGLGVISVLGGGRIGIESDDGAVQPTRFEFRRTPYASALLLIVAYGSSIGGVATPIGTATNVFTRGKLQASLGLEIPFLQWVMVGLPLTVVLFLGLTFWLGQWVPPAGSGLNLAELRESFRSQRAALGALSRGERNTTITFLLVIVLWTMPGVLAIVQGTQGGSYLAFKSVLPESIVALLAPVLLFLLPVDFRRGRFTLELEDISRIDWGTVILFGSGLSLGSLMERSGLAAAIGQRMSQLSGTDSVWAVTAVSILAAIVLSEFTSNVATVSVLLPVVISICQEAGLEPLPAALGVCFGASFGSCLPVSTPPNAIVYGSRLIPLGRMVRAGFGLDLLAAVAVWCVLRAAFALGWGAAG